jgi:hypothetical protein
MEKEKYVMTVSRTTVDKLGIKLYDKVSLAVGELIANSYDADAETVTVKIPLNRWLATVSGGKVIDQGLEIYVGDDGYGISPELINDFYLRVGADPRTDPRRGPLSSQKKKRLRMGRKGIGKLAPFGVCKTIEVKTAGGKITSQGYIIAHFILNYDDINQETDKPYYPDLGVEDGKYSQKTGTTIKLRNFLHRRTPDKDTFYRQLAKLFGLQLPDFKIEVVDTETGESCVVGQLGVEIEDQTKIDLSDRPVKLDDGTELPVTGWVAYSKHPYKNEEVAGVRIYARGRIVSTTRDFGLKAGFTGEHTIRSYLVGEIHANWLDKDDGEDLVHTGRQDILWDSEMGTALKKWGQELIKELGAAGYPFLKQKKWRMFIEDSKLKEEAEKRFRDPRVVDAAVTLGKTIGSMASLEELEDPGHLQRLKEFVLTVAPHKMLVDKLREIGETGVDRPLDAIVQFFDDVRIAETLSLGQVARERVDIITNLRQRLKSKRGVNELELQQMLEKAPWLIDPRWTVLQANQTFESLRSAFEDWYKKRYNKRIVTTTFKEPGIKPDFVMMYIGRNVEIVEIKKPGRALNAKEFERLQDYFDNLTTFLKENKQIQKDFPDVHVTLICDKLNLGRTAKRAYDKLEDDEYLEKKTWVDLLADVKKVHENFLATIGEK